MVDDPMKAELQRWGFAQVNRHIRATPSRVREHPITKARDFAPMTRANVAKRLAARDGRSRRTFMANGMAPTGKNGAQLLKIVPVWAVDAVPCNETRTAGPIREGSNGGTRAAVDIGTPDELKWIDRALARLARENKLRAMVVREEFCGVGTQRMKAAAVEREYGGKFNVRQYRHELARGLDYLRGSAK